MRLFYYRAVEQNHDFSLNKHKHITKINNHYKPAPQKKRGEECRQEYGKLAQELTISMFISLEVYFIPLCSSYLQLEVVHLIPSLALGHSVEAIKGNESNLCLPNWDPFEKRQFDPNLVSNG